MNVRLLWRFVVDRGGLILAFYVNSGLTLLSIGFLVGGDRGLPLAAMKSEFKYSLLVSTTVVLIYLAADLSRWWPFGRQVELLLESDAPAEALANLPPGGNLDQAMASQLVGRIDALWEAERVRFQEAHHRQLAFSNLWVHQMKTPVAAISLMTQDAQEQSPEELPATIAAIEDENLKVADGLEMVLNVARLQDFAMDYHIRRVDLLASVRQVISSRRRQFIRANILPLVEAEGSDWSVLTDEKWNRFVIDQLVANALKYASQTGKAEQSLHFRLARSAQSVMLTVADEGPGIPVHDLPRIYEPFFTGDNGRRFGGATGIGLYLVRQVVDHLHHELGVTSVEGQGASFTITYSGAPLQD